MRMIFWLSCLSYLLIGMAHVVLGSVLEPLITSYGLNYSQGSQLIFNQFAGFLFGVLVTPWLIGRVGRRNTLFIALIALTAAEFTYSMLPPWGWMLAVSPFAGFGFGMIEASVGALIIEFVTEKKASAMSRLEVAFGLGALLMPIAAGFLIRFGNWQWAFPLVTVISLATLILWRFAPLGSAADKLMQVASDKPLHPKPRYTKTTTPILLCMIIFFLIYVGLEMGFVHFVPSILKNNVGADASVAATGITAFWATMVVGRLFTGSLAERFGYYRYLIFCGSGTLLFMILFALTSQLWMSMLMIMLLGLFMSGLFAIALVFANDRIPGLTERTTSLLVASGGVGGALLPRLIGWTMDEYALGVTYGILIGSATMLIVLVLLAARQPKPQRGADGGQSANYR